MSPAFFSCLARPVAPDEPTRRYVGLKNQGATCHLNTVLQALYMTPEFRGGLLGCSAGELPPTGKAVVTVFSRMAQGGRTVSTKPLTSALRPVYVCTRQQDCHDTWLMLCDQLETALKGTPLAKLVAELFEGKQQDYVRCHACGTVTTTIDTFSNLSLAVPSHEDDRTPQGGGGGGQGEEEEDEEEDEEQEGAEVAEATNREPHGQTDGGDGARRPLWRRLCRARSALRASAAPSHPMRTRACAVKAAHTA